MKNLSVLSTWLLLTTAASISTVSNADVIEHPVKTVYKFRECSVLAMKMNRESLSRDHYLSALAATVAIGMTKVQFKNSWDRALLNWEFVEENMSAENFQSYVKAMYYPRCNLSKTKA